MNVSITETANSSIIKLDGEMKLGYEANNFQEAVYSSIEKNKKSIVVDLSGVNFLSSWGIGMLIHGYTTASNKNISFRLASVPEHIKETFNKIKINTIFHFYNTVDEAMNS